jgi:hypothetical protein
LFSFHGLQPFDDVSMLILPALGKIGVFIGNGRDARAGTLTRA